MRLYAVATELDFTEILNFMRKIFVKTNNWRFRIDGKYWDNETAWFLANPGKMPVYPQAVPNRTYCRCLQIFADAAVDRFYIAEVDCTVAVLGLFEYTADPIPVKPTTIAAENTTASPTRVVNTTICNVTNDVWASNVLLKTICYAMAPTTTENATAFAAANGMFLYAMTSEEDYNAPINYLNSIAKAADKTSFRINGWFSTTDNVWMVNIPDKKPLYAKSIPMRTGNNCLQIYGNATSNTFHVAELNCTVLTQYVILEFKK